MRWLVRIVVLVLSAAVLVLVLSMAVLLFERRVIAEPAIDHERLDVHRLAIDDAPFSYRIAKPLSHANRQPRDPWLRAAQSIPWQLAEGNGKQNLKDKNRSFEIACGSALEYASIHYVLRDCDAMDDESNCRGTSDFKGIVSMLTRWIQRTETGSED